jgi:hypothetical protein
MRFKNRFLIIFLVLLQGVVSCKKKFLDLPPYNAVPVDQAYTTEADLSTAVNGLYSTLRNAATFGRALPLKGDLMADNVYLKFGNSGRYLTYRDYNQTVANGEANDAWNALYVSIKNANQIINAEITSSKIVDQIKGEAYAVRGLVYFELLRNFAKPYTVDPNGLGVPIVTTFDQNLLPPRNTTKEVYNQIISDLNKAYTLMTYNVGQSFTITATNSTKVLNSSYFTKYAAKALLARVYQTMGDWAAAKDAALDVITNGGFNLVSNASYVAYWANPAPSTNKVETMFEVSLDNSGNLATNALAAFYQLVGYGDAWVTTETYNQYTATDVRRQVILVNTSVSTGNTVYINNKYSNTSNAADKDDVKILRYADVILILAEAYANLNDEPNALTRLNSVATNRDPGFAGYSSSGQQLKNDIVSERRKEFAFEGYRFYDLLRLNLPIPNHTKSQFPTVLFAIATTDYHRIFPIPQAEMDVNPNIRSQQNAGY